jgi:putative spermidine/putrescine transport system permease protein
MNMTATTLQQTRSGRGGVLRRASGYLYRHSNIYLLMLLTPPLLWFGVVYLGSLIALLSQSVYRFDDFTMAVTPDLTFANYLALVHDPANYDIVLRTLGMASSVTVASALLAFPVAYYMARYATGWRKGLFYVAVMLPMWASYIVKVYSWTVILAQGGIVYCSSTRSACALCSTQCCSYPRSAAVLCPRRTSGASSCLHTSGCRS